MPRPEFCKINTVSIAKYEGERKEAEKENRNYLLSKRKTTPHKETDWAERVSTFDRKFGY